MKSNRPEKPFQLWMHIKTIWKYTTIAIILACGIYLLLPPVSDRGGSIRPAAGIRTGGDIKYVIKVSPGTQYLPDTIPFGIGKPLQGLNKVITDFEKRYKDTRIEVLNVPRDREYLITQLSSGVAPDIVNSYVEDVWVDVQKDWYVPLDVFLEAPNPFVLERNKMYRQDHPDQPDLPGTRQWWDMFRYQAISRGKAAPNGKNYCLSLDMVETGIFYNKTYFDSLGLEVPQTWEEFTDVMARIKKDGKIPLLMNIGSFNDWCKDLIFDQLYYDLSPGIDLKKDVNREAYLQGYLDPEELVFLYRKGFFTRDDPRYMQLWKIMRQLRRYTNDNLNVTDLTREFVTQQAAMYWTASSITYRLSADRKLGFEWGVFYLPQFTRKTSKYASQTQMCVIGGASTQFEVTCSAVGDTDASLPMETRMRKSERLKRVIAFLQFLCLPENTERVVNEYTCFLPNIVGVQPLEPLKPFHEILERRYTTTKWIFSFDLRFSEIQERMLSLYLSDGVDLDEFMIWQEKNIASAAESIARRKALDFETLEAEWKRLAPVRAGMTDLPPEPKAQPEGSQP